MKEWPQKIQKSNSTKRYTKEKKSFQKNSLAVALVLLFQKIIMNLKQSSVVRYTERISYTHFPQYTDKRISCLISTSRDSAIKIGTLKLRLRFLGNNYNLSSYGLDLNQQRNFLQTKSCWKHVLIGSGHQFCTKCVNNEPFSNISLIWMLLSCTKCFFRLPCKFVLSRKFKKSAKSQYNAMNGKNHYFHHFSCRNPTFWDVL